MIHGIYLVVTNDRNMSLNKLVDTLERSKGIGQISALQLKAPNADVVGGREKMCVLRLDFRGMVKS